MTVTLIVISLLFLLKCLGILNPQSTLDWEHDCGQRPDEMAKVIPLYHAVLLHGKIYVGVTVSTSTGKVYFSDTDLRSWTSLSVPGDVIIFGLGTYHSQLVLAGGMISSTKKKVSDVWASDDGTNWQQSEFLPPLSVACSYPTIINTGSPEYLLVAVGPEFTYRVDVLIEKQWVSILPLPKLRIRRIYHSTIHNENLYLGGTRDFASYCRLDSLLTACDQARTGERDTTAATWRPLNCPLLLSDFASFGKQLVVFIPGPPVTISAYSPLSQSWVHVGDIPKGFTPTCSIVISSEELLVIGYSIGGGGFKVLKAVLRGIICIIV